jgi:hypothetical protein
MNRPLKIKRSNAKKIENAPHRKVADSQWTYSKSIDETEKNVGPDSAGDNVRRPPLDVKAYRTFPYRKKDEK